MYCYYCMAETEEIDGKCSVCHKESKEPDRKHLRPGTILRERFLVGNVLGSGGFGITYIGRDQTLNTLIAIKEYFPNEYADRDTVSSEAVVLKDCPQKEFFEREKKRFLTEARTLAQFNNQGHIVHAHDYFELNDTAYIVMDFVSGENLLAYMRNHQTLISPERAVEWFVPLLKVLAKVHEKGLIHRDISPDNILVDNDDLVLIDFGAARNVVDSKTRSVTMKDGYTPIEQCVPDSEPGPWMDVYAVCATIYRCITGKIPIASSVRSFRDELLKPSELGISIPQHIEDAIMHGLAVDYRVRTQTMQDLVAELSGKTLDPATVLMTDAPTELIVGGMSGTDSAKSGTAAGHQNSSGSDATESVQTKKRGPVIPVALAACVAGAAGFGIWHFSREAKKAENSAAMNNIIEEVSSRAGESENADSQDAASSEVETAAGEIVGITGKYLFRNYMTDQYICFDAQRSDVTLTVFQSDPECVMEIMEADGEYARYIRPVQSSDKVLNPASPKPTDGNQVILYKKNTDGTQYWLLEQTTESTMFTIRSYADNDLVLAPDGERMHLETYDGSKNQIWILTRYSGGSKDESTKAESSDSEDSRSEKDKSSRADSSSSSSGNSQRDEQQSSSSSGNRPSRQESSEQSSQKPDPQPQQQQPESKEDPKPVEVQSDYYFSDYGGGCIITGLKNNMGDLNIPEYIGDKQVLAIGDNAFSGNTGIRSVSMPDSIETVGADAFADCSNLSSVRFSRNLRRIGDYAFCNTGLYELELPESLREICEGAFYGNGGFEQIMIPYGVETIGDYAFGQCDMLESIYIAVTVNHIGVNAFKSDPPTAQYVEYGGSSAEWDMNDFSRSAFALDWNDPDIAYNVSPEWAFS
ncbi:MAG: leucine-rich repeat protein [Oscillospiraceae bacterium]|nr:leucine-rich repeat protein [Oscillospiraceae bacterium]